MFGWFRKNAMAQEQEMLAQVDAVVAERLRVLQDGILTEFANRLGTIWDGASGNAEAAADAEWRILHGAMMKMLPEMRSEIDPAIGHWLDMSARQGVRPDLDKRVDAAVDAAFRKMSMIAEQMVKERLRRGPPTRH